MKKKVMAVVLSLAMAATTVPWEALASEGAGPGDEMVVVEEEATAAPAALEDEAEAVSLEETPAAVESPAEDAVIVDDTVEIAGIEELEIPAEDAVSEDEPAAADEVAVEVVEDPELTDTDTPQTIATADPNKTSKGAYGLPSGTPQLSVYFDIDNVGEGEIADIKENEEDARNYGWDEFVFRSKRVNSTVDSRFDGENKTLSYEVDTGKHVVYDPVDKIPNLVLTWSEVVEGEWSTVELKQGRDKDYTCKLDDENPTGTEGTAYLRITFQNEYSGIKDLRLKYTIDRKDIRDNDIEITWKTPAGQYDSVKGQWNFTYNGKKQRPEIESITYKGVPLTIYSEKEYNELKKKPTGDACYVSDPEKDAGTYWLEIHGLGNYTETKEVKYVIAQKTAQPGDIEVLDRKTFFIGFDHTEVSYRLTASVKDTLSGESLRYGVDYEIYFYKVEKGEVNLYPDPELESAVPGNDVWKKDLGKDAEGNDKWKALKADELEKYLGEFQYRIRFTGNGNFKETRVEEGPFKETDEFIGGTFYVVNKIPNMADVYDAIKGDIADSISKVEGSKDYEDAPYGKTGPIYDATDWLVREGGDSDPTTLIDANDVTEAIKQVFNKYCEKDIEDKAHWYGNNIKVSLKPGQSEDGKMINAGSYIVRIMGINDWADQGYIDMDDQPVEIIPRELDNYYTHKQEIDSKTIDEKDDINGNKDVINYVVGNFYGFADVNLNKVDPYYFERDDKYGAIQYLKTYKAKGYDDPVVMITQLVNDKEETMEYPLTEAGAKTRDKKLVVHDDFEILTKTVADGHKDDYLLASVTIVGKGNYGGIIKINNVTQKDQVNLMNGKATAEVKTLSAYTEAQGGLDLNYNKGAGIDVRPENVNVTYDGAVLDYDDYRIENSDGCGDRHVYAGEHYIKVVGKNRSDGEILKVSFNVGGLDFGTDYTTAVKGTSKLAPVYVGQKVKKGEAPHDNINVIHVGVGGEKEILNYQTDYEFVCYVQKAQLDAVEGDLAKIPEEEKIRVRDEVEFDQAGAWVLVIRPAGAFTSGARPYTGYTTYTFDVLPKQFKLAPDGTISVKPQKVEITWPGQGITGAEIAAKLTVEDTETILNQVLSYNTDYTIDGTPVTESKTVTLKGVEGSNYNSADEIPVEVTVLPVDFKDAKARVELKAGALDYTGAAFTGAAGEVKSESVKVTVVINDREIELDPADYTVAATGESEVGSEVKVTVTGVNHYTGTVTATGTVTPADISNEDIFALTGIVDMVYTGEAVTQPNLKLTDTRTGKEVAFEATYANNDKVGEATVTVTPTDPNYTGTASGTFQITDQTFGSIVLKAESFPYKGAAYTVEDVIQAVYDAQGKEIAKSRYTAKMDGDTVNAGTASVTVTIKVNGEDVSLGKSFTITPVAITEMTNLAAEYVYNGTVIRPNVSIAAGKQILPNKDYVIYNTEDPNVGTKEIVVQAIGNYTGSIAKQFKVVPASVEKAAVTGVKASYKYNGAARQPKVKVTVSGRVLKKDVDYKVVYSADSTTISGKTVTIEGTGNYTGSLAKSYSVVPAKATVDSVKAGKKKLTVRVDEQEGVNVNYQIQYRVKGKSSWKSAKATGTKKVLKSLKSGKKYEVRVRAFATIGGKRVNGAWSKVTASSKVK